MPATAPGAEGLRRALLALEVCLRFGPVLV